MVCLPIPTPVAQNRWYDATTRRFTAIDPIKDGGNWYVYVGNNPVNWIDPFGLAQTSVAVSGQTISAGATSTFSAQAVIQMAHQGVQGVWPSTSPNAAITGVLGAAGFVDVRNNLPVFFNRASSNMIGGGASAPWGMGASVGPIVFPPGISLNLTIADMQALGMAIPADILVQLGEAAKWLLPAAAAAFSAWLADQLLPLGTVTGPIDVTGAAGAALSLSQAMMDAWTAADVTTLEQRDEQRFFQATIGPNNLIIPGRPLTTDQAEAYIRALPRGGKAQQGVITFLQADALDLTTRLGGPTRPAEISAPGRHGVPGYFYHYHPRDNPSAHIWYVFGHQTP